jgi:hypothetical protein
LFVWDRVSLCEIKGEDLIKSPIEAGAQWLKPVIPVTQEAEIRRIEVRG